MKPYPIFLHILTRYSLLALCIEALLGALCAMAYSAVFVISGGSTETDIVKYLKLLVLVLVPMSIAFPIGAIIGATIGVVTGFINGLLVGVLTLVAFLPLSNVRRYRLVIGIVSAATTILLFNVIAWPVFYWIVPFPAGPLNTQSTASIPVWGYSMWPALIAGAGAWWVSSRVARWYESEVTAAPLELPTP